MRISDWSSDVCSSDLAVALSLRTVRPWRRTSSGRSGNAACTLFWTSMTALSGSKPIAKLATSCTLPFGAVVEIGRASCRETGWPSGEILLVAVSLKTNTHETEYYHATGCNIEN